MKSMRKKVGLLVLAGVLAWLGSEGEGVASCTPQCWEGPGIICCVDSNCLDSCWWWG